MTKRKASEHDAAKDPTFHAAASTQGTGSLTTAIDNLTRTFPASSKDYLPVSKKFAAVLVPLFQDAEGTLRVMLTQRSQRLSSHKGEVCLPGGKRDPEDDDSDVATALREAKEEAVVHCSLPPCLSKHFLSVVPVVATIPSDFIPSPNANEVAAVFDVPLETFLRPAPGRHSHKDCAWDDLTYRLHFFETEDGKFTVWGLTAIILIQVAKCAFGCSPSYQEHAPESLLKGYVYADVFFDEAAGKVQARKMVQQSHLGRKGRDS